MKNKIIITISFRNSTLAMVCKKHQNQNQKKKNQNHADYNIFFKYLTWGTLIEQHSIINTV